MVLIKHYVKRLTAEVQMLCTRIDSWRSLDDKEYIRVTETLAPNFPVKSLSVDTVDTS